MTTNKNKRKRERGEKIMIQKGHRSHGFCKLLHKYCIFLVLYAFWPHCCITICKMTEHWLNKFCKLSFIKDCTATQQVFGVIPAVTPHSSLPCTTSPENEGWNLYNDKKQTNTEAAVILQTMRRYCFTAKSYPCTLWSVAFCLWMKFAYFSENQ